MLTSLFDSFSERAKLPFCTNLAEQRLAQHRIHGEWPRIALVKQDCNEDLYCCSSDACVADMLKSTLLRSGPISLFARHSARFLIVRTEPDAECNIWREKSEALKWAPATWFEGFREHVPGREHGQSKFARSVDEIDWSEFDLVISVDVSVPARVTVKYPNTVWAYYVRELKAPSWRSSFDRPIVGQDLFLSHLFTPRRSRRPPHVVDYPYHFHHCGVFHEITGATWPESGRRRGVFVEYHTARSASDEELASLSEFGPVYARRVEHDQFDAVSGERIPERSMSPEGLKALLSSKYHVKWGGRGVFGTAKVEAIAAGCLVLSDRDRDATPFLQTSLTATKGFQSLIGALRRLEADDALYQRERLRQQRLVNYLCYLRPANDLIDAWLATRKRKLRR